MVVGALIVLMFMGMAFWILIALAGFALPYAIHNYMMHMLRTKVLPRFRRSKD